LVLINTASTVLGAVQCIFIGNDGEQLLRTLYENPAQLKVFDNQFLRLGKALGEAEALVAKWARPFGIKTAARVIKANLDKEDIRDVGCFSSFLYLYSCMFRFGNKTYVGYLRSMQQPAAVGQHVMPSCAFS
jgi:hypothetical protein